MRRWRRFGGGVVPLLGFAACGQDRLLGLLGEYVQIHGYLRSSSTGDLRYMFPYNLSQMISDQEVDEPRFGIAMTVVNQRPRTPTRRGRRRKRASRSRWRITLPPAASTMLTTSAGE